MTHPLQKIAGRMRDDAKRAETLRLAIGWIKQHALRDDVQKPLIEIYATFAKSVEGSHEAGSLLKSQIDARVHTLWTDALSDAEAELGEIEERYRSLLHPPTPSE